MSCFKPAAIVLQCGADCLAGDHIGGMNVTVKGFGSCVLSVLATRLPLLILGGGGYHDQNTARCWTYVTSLVLGTEMSNDIPEHPSFES
jgi:acetoin utilization deacetylase AcuC-like enzyme